MGLSSSCGPITARASRLRSMLTRVTELMGISSTTVGSIVERVVARRLDASRLEDLRRIGIDDFSYRKRHRYLTTVVDHDRRRVVWASAGRTAETLSGFFEALGEEGCRRLECVTMDMAGGTSRRWRRGCPVPRSSSIAFMSSAWPPTPSTRSAQSSCARSGAPKRGRACCAAASRCSRTRGT